MKPVRLLIVAFLLALTGALSACLTESRQQGVVALVNGQPISLRLVEARHDASGGLAAIAQNPSVDLLQQQYGAILAELIVQELAAQELERLGLGVTEEDVDRAIDMIRSDYEDESFSEVLFEDHVDEKAWRTLLRYTVAMPRFNEQVLRPKVRLTEAEVKKYYTDHAAEFTEPSRLSLLVLTGPSLKAVSEARDRILARKGNESLRELPGVRSQRVNIRPALLPEIWQDEIGKLTPGKSTKVLEADEMFQCLILEKNSPERLLSPVEAYLQIEQVLAEKHMEELFSQWLDAAIAGARISVTTHLLQRGQDKAASPEQDADPRNSEPILGTPDEGNENGASHAQPERAAPSPAPGGTGCRDKISSPPSAPAPALTPVKPNVKR